ncbi:F-box protein At5g07610-like [Bidens hawaiensis]|uniref:F-box protein At5g07610-like n=1 Tax=Bidens hawaiensis TaxID=980011 RepID=UPI00404989FC
MAITRSKIRKTRNALKPCLPQASTTDSDHQLTSSAERIGSNDDILTEILLRLPVIFILQCKSVSKYWEWLLSHRHFTLRHDKLQISPGLFIRNNYIPFDVEDRSPPPFRRLDLCPDLNAIAVVYAIVSTMWSIPPPNSLQSSHLSPEVTTLKTKSRPLEYLLPIQIYYSETREWKTNNHFCTSRYPDFGNGVFCNGAIYWPSKFNSWYFDLNIEKLLDLPLPLSLQKNCFPPIYFGESRGHLHLMDTVGHGSDTYLTMYELLADHSGWFVKYTVELPKYDLALFHPCMIKTYWRSTEVLDVVRGEKEEDAFMVLKIWRSIIRYNLLDNSFKTLFDMTDRSIVRIYNDAHRYIQSLT